MTNWWPSRHAFFVFYVTYGLNNCRTMFGITRRLPLKRFRDKCHALSKLYCRFLVSKSFWWIGSTLWYTILLCFWYRYSLNIIAILFDNKRRCSRRCNQNNLKGYPLYITLTRSYTAWQLRIIVKSQTSRFPNRDTIAGNQTWEPPWKSVRMPTDPGRSSNYRSWKERNYISKLFILNLLSSITLL